MDWQSFLLEDGLMERLVGKDTLILGEHDLRGIGLRVGINEEDRFAFPSQSCCEGDRGGCFAGAALLGHY